MTAAWKHPNPRIPTLPSAPQERVRLAALLTTAAFMADWASKSWALDALHRPMPLGSLMLEVERNAAFAFSLGRDVAPTLLVLVLRLVAIAALVLACRRFAEHSVRYTAGAALILGGGLGNFADVLFREHGVVDFIGTGALAVATAEGAGHLRLVFNTADLVVLIGIALLAPWIQDGALRTQARLARWERRWLQGRRRLPLTPARTERDPSPRAGAGRRPPSP